MTGDEFKKATDQLIETYKKNGKIRLFHKDLAESLGVSKMNYDNWRNKSRVKPIPQHVTDLLEKFISGRLNPHNYNPALDIKESDITGNKLALQLHKELDNRNEIIEVYRKHIDALDKQLLIYEQTISELRQTIKELRKK